jgi:hypothetical protein
MVFLEFLSLRIIFSFNKFESILNSAPVRYNFFNMRELQITLFDSEVQLASVLIDFINSSFQYLIDLELSSGRPLRLFRIVIVVDDAH